MKIIELAAYFYADDGLVASTQPERLEMAFDILTGLFNRFVLLQHPPWCVAWLADYANRLCSVFPQDDPFKEAGEDVKCPL